MRTRRFRPAVDLLDRRIALSDVAPTPMAMLCSPAQTSDGCLSASDDPALIDLLGPPVVIYCSGTETGFNPLNSPLVAVH